jgi:hypothetical protein
VLFLEVRQNLSGKAQLSLPTVSSTRTTASIRAATSVILAIFTSMIMVSPGNTGTRNFMSLTVASTINSLESMPLPVVRLNKMGLEGIVSKRLDRAYGAGRCGHWIKVKNPAHPAYSRVRELYQFRSRRSA